MEPELDIYSELIGLIDDNFKPKEAVKIEKYLKKLYDDLVYDYKLNQIIPKVKEESNDNDN